MSDYTDRRFWLPCELCDTCGCELCRERGYLQRGWAHWDRESNVTMLVPGPFDDYDICVLDPSPLPKEIHQRYLSRGVSLTWVGSAKFSRMEQRSMLRDEGALGDIF